MENAVSADGVLCVENVGNVMMPAICVGPAMVVMLASSFSGEGTVADPKSHEKPFVRLRHFPKGPKETNEFVLELHRKLMEKVMT